MFSSECLICHVVVIVFAAMVVLWLASLAGLITLEMGGDQRTVVEGRFRLGR